jgi:hypothetical protein
MFKAARLGSLGGLYDRPGKSPQATMVTDGVRDVVVLYLNRPDNFLRAGTAIVSADGHSRLSAVRVMISSVLVIVMSPVVDPRDGHLERRSVDLAFKIAAALCRTLGMGHRTHYPRDGTKQP